jgi:hypothetical protein
MGARSAVNQQFANSSVWFCLKFIFIKKKLITFMEKQAKIYNIK